MNRLIANVLFYALISSLFLLLMGCGEKCIQCTLTSDGVEQQLEEVCGDDVERQNAESICIAQQEAIILTGGTASCECQED
ncbi:MAG: hypothetical protein AAGI38_05905 [Bacteroidota bacterium]